jgi:glucosamine--fructose-6-phosphate aminotransferase (isomerizing)
VHPALDPLVAVQAFYGFVAPLALARGLDPDEPPHLAKVTRTL